MNKRIKVNLQLFGDTGEAASSISQSGSEPQIQSQPAVSTETQTTAAEKPKSISDLLGERFDLGNREGNVQQNQESQTDALQAEQVQAPVQQTQQPTLFAGKFKTPDELERAYKELQSRSTTVMQERAATQRELEALKSSQRGPAQQVQHTAQTQTQPTVSPIDYKKFVEELYENPESAIKTLTESIEKAVSARMEEKVAPIAQKQEQAEVAEIWNRSVSEFAASFPDMAEFREDMARYITENNLGDSKDAAKVLTDAYYNARGKHYQPAQPINHDALLNDAAFQEKVLGNQAIRDKILQAHMASITQTTVPKSIDSNSNGVATAVPPNKLHGMKAAAQALGDLFDRSAR